jgi:4-hydroxymandelate oxidase
MSEAPWSLDRCVSLDDHEAWAQQHVPAPIWAYVQGGAGNEQTLRENSLAWQSIGLRPKVMSASTLSHTGVSLLGRQWPSPLLVAPMALQQLVHPHGELGTSLAAASLGVGMVLSAQSSCSLEDVANRALPDTGRGPLWMQLYPMPDRKHTLDLMVRAAAAGYEAIVLTVDAPVQGTRDRERRLPLQRPAHIRAVNLPPEASLSEGSWQTCLSQAPRWSDLEWLLSHTPLPILLKGITHPDDARMAVDMGVDGLIVSNHGGRILDTMAPSAVLLHEVLAAVGGERPVLVDGGIRRGTDVLKAMAMGAAAVLVGRPVLHGLANAGAQGAAHVMRLLLDELQMAMTLCGCEGLEKNPTLLRMRTFLN